MHISARHGDIYDLFGKDVNLIVYDADVTLHETKIKPIQLNGWEAGESPGDLEYIIAWLIHKACSQKVVAYFNLGHNETEAKSAADAICVLTEKFLQTECKDRENCKGELVYLLANSDPYIVDNFNVKLCKL